MNRIKSILLTAFMALMASSIHAQSTCDNLYAEGVKLQKTKTVSAQKSAITKFEKAKACYDSEAKKKQCDQQVKACRLTIKKLTAPKQAATNVHRQDVNDSAASITPVKTEERKVQKQDVTLSVSPEQVTFRAKGKEFKKVKVNCNYNDWRVTESPEWVKYSRSNDGEVIIEVPDKNPNTKDVRSGIIKIECGEASANIIIVQKRRGFISKIGIM